jgi:pyruvate dehydrogenase E2 component (dihydrolipoamide acetyltransferase)
VSIEVKMPALSPTMEEGTLAKWLVKVGDVVKAGDLIAEIETDKATMEFEAVDEGRVAEILIEEGADGVAVGTVIALITDEAENIPASATPFPPDAPASVIEKSAIIAGPSEPAPTSGSAPPPAIEVPHARLASKVKVSPLAARIAEAQGIDLSAIAGSGPGGRIVKVDLGLKPSVEPAAPPPTAPAPTPVRQAEVGYPIADVPHELTKLSNMRKVIARRLTESKQQVPHIYLTVDVRLDALLALRAELNDALAPRGIKLSVNDMIIKALALALIAVPDCNVQFADDQLARFQRADISVAVSIPGGLITPVIAGAEGKSLSAIGTAMKDLAARARDGKLQPHEYQGGTASLSNLGMFGIKQFDAVINPPQAMIMAVGAGERRAVVIDEQIVPATTMSATGSFDHRAIDGADAAALMQAFRSLLEQPLRLTA